MNTESDHHTKIDRAGFISFSLIPLSLLLLLVSGITQYPLPWSYELAWVSSLDLTMAFRVDAFSALMLLLITGIGTLVLVYASGYMAPSSESRRVFLVLPLFMLAMIGAVTADNVILLFLFWELTSIISFLLVGFKHGSEQARESARQALFVTMGGGIALLAGLLLLSDMAGSWKLSEIVDRSASYIGDPRLSYAIVLMLLGAFTKSAQFPFHFWLPNAMSAPTPVSAYLHSATMVKLGIYLMARLDPAFNDLLLWEILLIGTGIITAVWAAVLALRERDLKRILARSTLSALGTMTLLIGLPGNSAGLAVIAFLFAHAVYKAPLFMVAGNIDHVTGTRQIDHLMGLRRIMPWTALVAVLAGLSMAGLPMAFGFVAKDIMSVAKQQSEILELVSYALLLVNATAMAVAAVAAIRVFWGPLEKPFEGRREANAFMIVPPLLLALIGIEFELFPDFIDPMLLAAAQNISPSLQMTEIATSYSLQNLLSATGISALIALILFVAWDRIHNRLADMHWLDRFGPEASYQGLMTGLKQLAAAHTRLMQSGRLDHYLLMTILAMVILGMAISGYAYYHDVSLTVDQPFVWQSHGWAWLVSAVLISSGALAAVMLQKRLAVLLAVGLVGYGSAVLFLFAGAPDLAFTQFSVETILVVIAAVLLPLFRTQTLATTDTRRLYTFGRFWFLVKLMLAALAATGTYLLLNYLQSIPQSRDLLEWFGANSLPEANGRNVVNVIIVDFRALDTLGEIAVVVVSLLAAMPLFRHLGHGTSQYSHWSSEQASEHSKHDLSGSVLLEKVSMPIYWLMLVAALVIVIRGHNNPGGGFIGGLVAVAASSQLALLHGLNAAKKFQFVTPVNMALTGVAVAMLAGIPGLIIVDGFLRHVELLGVATVLIFDLGVFLAVWGSFNGYIFALLGRYHRKSGSEPDLKLASKPHSIPDVIWGGVEKV